MDTLPPTTGQQQMDFGATSEPTGATETPQQRGARLAQEAMSIVVDPSLIDEYPSDDAREMWRKKNPSSDYGPTRPQATTETSVQTEQRPPAGMTEREWAAKQARDMAERSKQRALERGETPLTPEEAHKRGIALASHFLNGQKVRDTSRNRGNK